MRVDELNTIQCDGILAHAAIIVTVPALTITIMSISGPMEERLLG